MQGAKKKVLVTGAAGYIASQLLPIFRQRYRLVLIDVRNEDREGRSVENLEIADLIDPDRSSYVQHFEGIDAVVHLGYRPRSGNPIHQFFDEKQNVEMAYNVLRTAYESGVPRAVLASSNHAADWYEHNLLHAGGMEMLDPYKLPLSDNFYGWAKATYEHLGFLFACGISDFADQNGDERHVSSSAAGRKMGVVMVRIGAPRELEITQFADHPAALKRELGAYISSRDLTQLFIRAIEEPNIENQYGVPWQVVYGISNNTRAFWSLRSARQVLGYQPEDDSEVKYAAAIRAHLTARGDGAGRLGPV